MDTIYLDNAATRCPLPEVVDAVSRAMREGFGNSSSLHRLGLKAAKAVREAADAVECTVGGGPWRVVFTSGGSESDTMAILGAAPRSKRDKVVTTALEHSAVMESCRRVEELGGQSVQVSGGTSGVVNPDEMAKNVCDKTALLSVVHVAPEMGTIQPVEEIAIKAKERSAKCLVHVDAVQACAELPSLFYPREVDMVSLSAHKIGGPMGVGALLLRPTLVLKPIICGGDQQWGFRPGTLNVPGIVGFQAAVQTLAANRMEGAKRMRALTEALIAGIVFKATGVRALGDPVKRAPGIAVLAVKNAKSEALLHALEARGVIASSSSACHSTRSDPPQCLKDAGLKSNEGALRLSLSFDTTADEIERAAREVVAAVKQTVS